MRRRGTSPDGPRLEAAVSRRALGIAGAAVVTAVLSLAAVSHWWEQASRPAFAREALAAHFESDIRNLVYRWNPDDARPKAERDAALFDFVHQTYGTSAWVPQSVFDTSLVTQTFVGDIDTIIRDNVGLVLWRENAAVPAYGMAPSLDPGRPMRWTVSCLVCHTAAIRAGTIRLKGAVTEFTAQGARFADGSHEPFDRVILATGYTAALGIFGGLVRTDPCGFALRRDRVVSAEQRGLYFVGHNYDTRGGLRNIAADARLAAAAIARQPT